jgi:hypothetical protein
VNGVRTEVAGLASWARLSVVNRGLLFDIDDSNSVSSEARLEWTSDPRHPISLGADGGIELVPDFETEESDSNSTYTVRERVYTQTWRHPAADWHDHLPIHWALQDLMTIVYWSPCGIRLEMVSREDDAFQNFLTRESLGKRWRPVIADWGGRGNSATPMTISDNARPLFSLADMGVDNLRRWIDESSQWTRVVGPLVSTVYLARVPVEVSVMQVGVSIEALGHRIAVRQNAIQPDGRLSFPEYLHLINDTLQISISDVLRGDHRYGVGPFQDFEDWGYRVQRCVQAG